MKRVLLALLALLTVFALIACDSSVEGTDKNSKTESTSNAVSDDEISIWKPENSDSEPGEEDIIEKLFSDVNVHLSGTDILEKSGFVADSSFMLSIDVTAIGKKRVLDSLLAEYISCYIDVSGVTETGEVDFLISCDCPEGVEGVTLSQTHATVKISKKNVDIPPVKGDAYVTSSGIIISGTRAMEQFGGGASAGAATAEKLNAFKKAIGDNVNVYVMSPPLASAFYAPEKYPNSIANHQKCYKGMSDALEGVKYVDLLSALSAHTDEAIYPRTDHHWSALGAYYAVEEFSKVAGTPFDKLSTFEVKSFDGFVGSLYTFSKDSVLKNNPETFTWYVPTREHTVEYYSRDKVTNPKTGMTLFSSAKDYTKFVYGDSYTTHIISNVGNGRKLLVFKDSYGNALAPFLVSCFDEVYIADFRYFDLDVKQFAEDKGITDICFSLSAFAVGGSGGRNNIQRITNKIK